MEVDHNEESQESTKVVDESLEKDNDSAVKEQEVFTVDELLNDFASFPICFKIKYIMSVYSWDDDQYGNIKNAIFDHPMSKDEFEEKLPRLLASISRAISEYPNGIVLDDSGNLLREQSIAQAKAKGIQNDYVEVLIRQENNQKRVQIMLEAISSKNFDTLRTTIGGEYAVTLAKTFLANNDRSFLNDGNIEKYIMAFDKSAYEPDMDPAMRRAYEESIQENLMEESENPINPDTPEAIKRKAKVAVQLLSYIYDLPGQAMEYKRVEQIGILRRYVPSVIKGDFRELSDEELITACASLITDRRGKDLRETLAFVKEETVAEEMAKAGEDQKIFIFLEERKKYVAEKDRMEIEKQQQQLLDNNSSLRSAVNNLLEKDDIGTLKIPDRIVQKTYREMTTQVAMRDFVARSIFYHENQKDKDSPEVKEEYTKYLLGIYKVFREDKDNIVSKGDVDFVLEFLKRLNPEMDLGEKKENGYTNEQAAIEGVAAKIIKKETGKEEVTPKDAQDYLRSHSEVLRDNYAAKIQRHAFEYGKIKDSSSAFQEFLDRSSEEIYVDDSIRFINTNNIGKLNSYRTKVLFTQEEQALYDRVKKTVTVDSWVDNSNKYRMAYLSSMLKLAHLKDIDSSDGASVGIIIRQMQYIEQRHPSAVKDLMGRNFIGMTDKKFEEVKYSEDFADRKEDVAAYEEALKFNCKKVEARVFEFFESEIFPVNAMSKYKFAAPQEKAQILKYAMLAKELANQTSEENVNLRQLYTKMSQRALDVLTNGRTKEIIKYGENGQPEVDQELFDKAVKEQYKLIFGDTKDKHKTSADLFEYYKFDYVQDKVIRLSDKRELRDLPGKKNLKPVQEMNEHERKEAGEYYDSYYREIRRYKKLNDKEDMRASTGNKVLEELIKPIRKTRIFRRGVQAARAYHDYGFKKATKMCLHFLARKGSDQKKRLANYFLGQGKQMVELENRLNGVPLPPSTGPTLENKMDVYVYDVSKAAGGQAPKVETNPNHNQVEAEQPQQNDEVKQADSDQDVR